MRAALVTLTALLLALALPLDADEGQATVGRAAVDGLQRIRFEHLTNREGLSQMTVYAIVQDRQGFMWFGTQNGLNRYDGYTFRVFSNQSRDADSLSHSFVRALHEDRSGKLWIGTYGGGLNRFDPVSEVFTHFRHDPDDAASLSHDDVRAVVEDRSGALWVGTRGGGLNRFDPVSEVFTHFRHDPDDAASLSHDDVRVVLEDHAGGLWVGTHGGGLSRWQPESRSFLHYRHVPGDPGSLCDDRVRALHEDRAGDLWAGTNGGLARWQRATDTFVCHRHRPQGPTSLAANRIRSIHEDSAGRLWIGTRGRGLDRFDREGGVFRHYRHDPSDASSLSDDDVYSIYEDRSQGLWIGTFDGGVNRVDPNRATFSHYRHDPSDDASLSHNEVRSLAESQTGEVWIGTFGGGVDRFDPATETFRHFRHDPGDGASLRHDDVRAVHEDRSGVLWVGTFGGGLGRFEPAGGTFRHFRHDPGDAASLSHDDVFAVLEDRVGALWVATLGGGLNRLAAERLDRAAGRFTRYRHDPGDAASLSSDDVYALFEDRSGVLWIGTRGGGLNRFDADATGRAGPVFTHYRHDPADPGSLSYDDVSCLFEDRAGRLWIGTYGGGLNRMDAARETFTRIAGRGVAENASIHGILQDDFGRMWLSTNRGLSRFDPVAQTWSSYDVRDGLQDDQFNGGAALHSTRGEMYFGGIGGFNVFRPERFQTNAYVPPVVLTSFKVFERKAALPRSISTTAEIELGYRQSFFAFEFAALSFTRPDKNRYSYRLEGFDGDWVDPGSRRYASYTNVPPGEYVFRVKGSNNDGVWNEAGTSVRIVIAPPWWRTWWARLAGLLAAAALLSWAHRSALARNRRLEKERIERERAAEREQLIAELAAKNTELERFTYAVSHDLKSPLVTIKGFLGYLENDAAAGDVERLRSDVERIRNAADQMQLLVDDLLALSRVGRQANPPQEVPLDELVREAAALVAGAIAERGVEVEVAPDLPSVFGDRGRLLEVLQNLLENAVKYMGDQTRPRVEIGARQGAAETICTVRDNGIGIEPEYHEKVFGLFDRLDTGVEGSGFGLALVRRIVEVHGGRVWVESQGTGQGSTFCFALPRPGGKKSAPSKL